MSGPDPLRACGFKRLIIFLPCTSFLGRTRKLVAGGQILFQLFEAALKLHVFQDPGTALENAHQFSPFERRDFAAPYGLRYFLGRLLQILSGSDGGQTQLDTSILSRRADPFHADAQRACIALQRHHDTFAGHGFGVLIQ
jgi:hypothetical protein